MNEFNAPEKRPNELGGPTPRGAGSGGPAGWSPDTGKSKKEQLPKGAEPTVSPPATTTGKPGQSKKLLLALALIAGGMFLFGGGGNEEASSPNWSLHEKAGNGPSGQLINQAGAIVPSIELSRADENTTLQSQAAAAVSNPTQLAQIIQVQQPSNVQVSPDVGAQLAPKVSSGQVKFYQVNLWDTCAEDGDVVDVLVDGAVFATVNLMNAQTTVSIPCGPGTSVSIAARIDGGGGVTLGASTSAGQYFTPVLNPGETLPLSLSF